MENKILTRNFGVTKNYGTSYNPNNYSKIVTLLLSAGYTCSKSKVHRNGG
jgi:hypothetical protein